MIKYCKKQVGRFVTIASTSIALSLTVTGVEIIVVPITTVVACGLAIGNIVEDEMVSIKSISKKTITEESTRKK